MQIHVTRFSIVGIHFLYSLGSIPGGAQRFSPKAMGRNRPSIQGIPETFPEVLRP